MHILITVTAVKWSISILKLGKNHVPYYVAKWDIEENQIVSI